MIEKLCKHYDYDINLAYFICGFKLMMVLPLHLFILKEVIAVSKDEFCETRVSSPTSQGDLLFRSIDFMSQNAVNQIKINRESKTVRSTALKP